jgi:hypothetical protein
VGGAGRGEAVGGAKEEELGGDHTQERRWSSVTPVREEEGEARQHPRTRKTVEARVTQKV